MMRYLKNIIVFLIVFVICLLVLDRFIFFSESVTVNLYEYNSKIGKTLIPGTNYLFTSEGFGLGSTNKFGYLGKPVSGSKSNKTLRIALLGDSYVESFQLFDRMHFGRIMENQLKDKYGIDAEVMNFGRSGFTLSDMYVYSENFVKDFEPDLIMYFVENDDFHSINRETGIPYPFLDKDSIKMHYFPEARSNTFFLFSLSTMSTYFPTVQMIRNSINLINEHQTLNIVFGKFYELFAPPPLTSKNQIFKPDSTLVQIVKDLSKDKRNLIVYRDKQEINPAINSLIQNSGIRFLNVNDTLNVAKNNFNPYYWKSRKIEGHWNISAHEVIGKFLADKISQYTNN